MRVADYVWATLVEAGIRDVFLVTGGGAMHLNDGLGRNGQLRWWCCHHEQACAMAAESYARLTGQPAVVHVTSGPGGTNAITGVHGAWTDSVPMVVISGQVKRETLVSSTGLPLRQLGDQELDIVPMIRSITKYAVMVTTPGDIAYHLGRALHLARCGRPGPVWLDIPLDVQAADIDPATLKCYDPVEDAEDLPAADQQVAARAVVELLASARRPVVLLGSGTRLAGQHEATLRLLATWGVPVVTAWNAHDLVPDDFPGYCGRPGTLGTRPGNYVIQCADLVISLGCRLNIRQISYQWKAFASRARLVVVDIDRTELLKPTLTPHLAIHADLRHLIPALQDADFRADGRHATWLSRCRELGPQFPACLPGYPRSGSPINPYVFAERLFAVADPEAIVVTGDGSACVVSFQTAVLQRQQRLYTNSGCASMGYDLPAAIGAAIAMGREKRITCLAGDGSVQMNLQELQTIAFHRLPITVIVLNNQGYHSIRQTQTTWFPGNSIGFDATSGVGLVPFSGLAAAFGLPFRACTEAEDLDRDLQWAHAQVGPVMLEVHLDPTQTFSPRTSSRRLPDGRMESAPLEDMHPFLPRDEHARIIAHLINGDPHES